MFKVVVEVDSLLQFFTDNKYNSNVICLQIKDRRSIKDLLESIRIPHVEIGVIYLDGQAVGWDAVLECDCRLKVLPAEPSFGDRFLLDVHLGKLTSNLRMLGFEAEYSRNRDDCELSVLSQESGLILLTCDRGLLMRRTVSRGMIVRSRDPIVQTAEVVSRFCLEGHFHLFSRCINCGRKLMEAGSYSELPQITAAAVPPGVRGWVKNYKICPACGRPYWKGSHFDGMYKRIDKIQNLSGTIRQTS